MFRSILAVFLGLVLAVVVIFMFEMIGGLIYPPPPGLDLANQEAMKNYVANLPIGFLLFLLLGWFMGAFCGAALAARMARRAPFVHALIVGGILMAAAIANFVMLPHPLWLWIVGLLMFPLAALAGAWAVLTLPRREGRSGNG